ncbi:MAG TPA: S-methyl-5'-thioadenosine phosphorylase [Alphaproteobacteria bacterium]|nr:S-methyl-5'-thioadenosine phosphorylase [Alphaproteobacteria bacterium]
MMAGERESVLGVIGGSGLYEIDGLTNTRWERVDSPFGAPSDDFLFGEIGGKKVVFCPRHGRGHRIPPTDINFRANIDAMKRAGVTEIVSVSAVGSLHEDFAPGTFVIVDQFIDRTVARPRSFFGTGMVAHVSMARPVCGRLAGLVEEVARERDIPTAAGGTYLAMEGPQFSSLAESELFRSWGAHVIGMTNMPEARLAREAEICYVTIAMVTDYDCWHEGHEDVTVEAIIATLMANADAARGLVGALAPKLVASPDPCPAGCHRSLDTALITAPEARDPEVLARLDAVAGRVLGT